MAKRSSTIFMISLTFVIATGLLSAGYLIIGAIYSATYAKLDTFAVVAKIVIYLIGFPLSFLYLPIAIIFRKAPTERGTWKKFIGYCLVCSIIYVIAMAVTIPLNSIQPFNIKGVDQAKRFDQEDEDECCYSPDTVEDEDEDGNAIDVNLYYVDCPLTNITEVNESLSEGKANDRLLFRAEYLGFTDEDECSSPQSDMIIFVAIEIHFIYGIIVGLIMSGLIVKYLKSGDGENTYRTKLTDDHKEDNNNNTRESSSESSSSDNHEEPVEEHVQRPHVQEGEEASADEAKSKTNENREYG